MSFESLAALRDKRCELLLPGASRPTSMALLDWPALVEQDRAWTPRARALSPEARAELASRTPSPTAAISEYFLDDAAEARVASGDWIPFAVLGVGYRPADFAETANDGLLVLDRSARAAGGEEPVLWIHDGEVELLAASLSELQVRVLEEPPPVGIEPHRAPPYAARWEAWLERQRAKDYDGALAILLPIVDELPDNPDVQLGLAGLYRSMKRRDDAFAAMDRAIALSNRAPFYVLTKATFLVRAKRFDDALASIDGLTTTSTQDEATRLAILATALAALGKRDDALLRFQQSLALDPNAVEDDNEWVGAYRKLVAERGA